MGEEIESTEFDGEARVKFKERLRNETAVLKKWFDTRKFDYSDTTMLGLEVEAWLMDESAHPCPLNDEFLQKSDHPLLVHELAQFNFEMNVTPQKLASGCFSAFYKEIEELWSLSSEKAKELHAKACLVGIPPTVKQEMLQPQFMSRSNRYKALNDQLFRLRDGKDLHIKIEGRETYENYLSHVMLEAAATSIQVHLQVNQEEAVRAMNASMILSAPLVAMSANSPYLYEKDLWDESRIPVFEQAVSHGSFRNKKGQDIGRVTFGTGYMRRSFLEPFLENLDAYPIMIPTLYDDPKEKLRHLKLQNGTVWRWNRPLIGVNSDGTPHLRIEQRVMPSGPSLHDIVANMAFYIGLAEYTRRQKKAPEESMTFTDCKDNFYKAAKEGLNAQIRWFGKEVLVKDLILKELLPKAKKGLVNAGVSKDEIKLYIDEIVRPRVESGQNGAQWQRNFIQKHGRDFESMCTQYMVHQSKGKPVHEWSL